MVKTSFKDILNVTITDSKKSVKSLTDKQVDSMYSKLVRLLEITKEESNIRYAKNAALEADEAFLEEEAVKDAEEVMNED